MWLIEKKRKRGAASDRGPERKKKPKAEGGAKKVKVGKQTAKGSSSVANKKKMAVLEYIDMKRQAYKKELQDKKDKLLFELSTLESKLPKLTARYQRRELLDTQDRKKEIFG